MFFRRSHVQGPGRRFGDRRSAGRALAGALREYAGRDDVIVLGLPRGGVPVAYEVAAALGTPLDVFLVRKLGVPGHEELAMGAVASGDVSILSGEIIAELGVTEEDIRRTTDREIAELHRREALYRGDRPPPTVAGRVVILVDDGLATGASMLAAVSALRKQDPLKLIVAVPVAPVESRRELRGVADDVVVVLTPEPFFSVGAWYEDFTQVSDGEVRSLLAASRGSADGAIESGSM